MPMTSPIDDDVSLATLFKLSKTRKMKNPEKETSKNADGKGIEDQVEKLITLLNYYSNWEIRGILVTILKADKAGILKDRLVGKGKEGEDSTLSSNQDVEADTSPHCSNPNTNTPESEGEAEQDIATSTDVPSRITISGRTSANRRRQVQRSRSGENLLTTMKLDRVGGSDRLDSRRRDINSGSVQRSSSGGRGRPSGRPRSLSADRKLGVGSDISSRRSKDPASSRQAAILAKRRELDKLRQASGTSAQENSKSSNNPRGIETSVSPVRPRMSNSEANAISRKGRLRSGSADDLLGLTASSFHAGAKRYPKRNSKNACVGHELGFSLHGTSTDRVASLLGLKYETETREKNVESSIDCPFLDTSGAPRPDDAGDAEFLQFQPGCDQNEQVTKILQGSVAVKALVNELKASSHAPIELFVEKNSETDNETTKRNDDRDKMLKRGLSFLRRRKQDQTPVPVQRSLDSDACSDLSDDSSDEESFG